MVSGCEKLRKDWVLVSSRLSFLMGNGRRMNFWKDKWCGATLLCVSFTSLFALAISKVMWVNNIWNSNCRGELEPSFSKPFNHWEVDYVESFLLRLHRQRVHRDEEDKMLWIETKSGKFIVRSLHNALESGNSVSFPMKIIWKSGVQPTVSSLLGRQCGEKL